MLAAAGKELTDFIGTPGNAAPRAQVREQDVRRLLMQWGELALWMIHYGPFRGKAGPLGVLGEVLGLVGKGVVWRGGEGGVGCGG